MDVGFVNSFAPLARADARVLVLGSMPGIASLTAAHYYAHPRNSFWTIVAGLSGCAPEAPYAARVEALLAAGIALWDVLARCQRAGSLDSDIRADSVRANDLALLYAQCPRIERVCFNGTAAAQWYRRLQLPRPPGIDFVALPSTSPAHAGMSYLHKQALWHQALRLA